MAGNKNSQRQNQTKPKLFLFPPIKKHKKTYAPYSLACAIAQTKV